MHENVMPIAPNTAATDPNTAAGRHHKRSLSRNFGFWAKNRPKTRNFSTVNAPHQDPPQPAFPNHLPNQPPRPSLPGPPTGPSPLSLTVEKFRQNRPKRLLLPKFLDSQRTPPPAFPHHLSCHTPTSRPSFLAITGSLHVVHNKLDEVAAAQPLRRNRGRVERWLGVWLLAWSAGV